MAPALSDPLDPLDQIADRVESLLLRHAELHRTNVLLARQLALVTQERDGMRARLDSASARLDALVQRLPPGEETA